MSQQAISARRQAVVAGYAKSWERMIRQWRAPRGDDAVWLMYAANYLFNTRGLKWAVDPVLLNNRVPEATVPDAGRDLDGLDFILLTHGHLDHSDVALWTQLSESRCHWIVPDHMLERFAQETTVHDANRSVARPGEEIVVAGARVTPFASPHYERRATGELSHVASTGYHVEAEGASYLFPGDIRTYDPACLVPHTDVSAVFAHIFLGRGAALERNPPLLDAFVDFYLSCRPGKIVLTHLYELPREPESCWLTSHAETAAEALRAADDRVEVSIPEWYQETVL